MNQPLRDSERHGPKNISWLFVVFFFFKHQLTVFSLTVFSFLKSLSETSTCDLFCALFSGSSFTCQVWAGGRGGFFFHTKYAEIEMI